MGTDSLSSSNKDNGAIFAIVSLILGILDLPAFVCGFFFALAFGMGGMVPLFLISLALPIVLCLGGIISGVIGLGSKRRLVALIGIVLPGSYLLLICAYFFTTMIIGPNTVPTIK